MPAKLPARSGAFAKSATMAGACCPRHRRRLARKIQPDHAKAALAHHAEEQSAAASDVEQRTPRRRIA
jgi:hypothetical protein